MKEYALITGASGGLGKQFAYLAAKDGYNLVLVARREDKLLALAKEINESFGVEVLPLALDLQKEQFVADLIEKTKDLDIGCLINNAGFGYLADYVESELSHQKELLRLNVEVLMELTHHYGAKMKEKGKGYILNIASTAALSPGPHMSTYFASKSYVLSFSEALHEELRKSGVKVSALCPGPVDTDFEKNANMKDSAMFHSLPVSKPEKIARKGYKGLKKGKAVIYAGPVTHWMAFFSRIFPRKWMRKIIGRSNAKTVKSKNR